MSGGIDEPRRDALGHCSGQAPAQRKFYTESFCVLCATAVNPMLDSAFDVRISDLIFEGPKQ
jgi:hypothetical protein